MDPFVVVAAPVMSDTLEAYELVVGLEVHAQLLTRSKLFCGDATIFGAAPNSEVSPITLGYPGTLPKLNRQAVKFALRMGLACQCRIERVNYFARKNYFYPDLPKGYQISQHTTPICKGGHIQIKTPSGESKPIALNRIHLEEDAGKSVHDADPQYSSLDFNRAGVPLIEIVTEPVIRSSEEAVAFLTELRKMLRYLEICDGNMEEGSLRCDANISVRKKGESALGTKVEIKNLNSIRYVKKAIEHERTRLIGLLEKGEPVIQQTRSFDEQTQTSFALRAKEEANDYRYFPDPDLPPFEVTEQMLAEARAALPELPDALKTKYTQTLELSEYDAALLTEDKATSDYFEKLITHTKHFKAAANWLLGPLKSQMNERGLSSVAELDLPPGILSNLIKMVDEGLVSFSAASSRILPALLQTPGEEPMALASRLQLLQTSDKHQVDLWVQAVLNSLPEKVAEYRKGKKGLIGLFVGEVKKLSNGKADPKLTSQLLLEKLGA